MSPIDKLAVAIKNRNWQNVADVYSVLSGKTIEIGDTDDLTSIKLQFLEEIAASLVKQPKVVDKPTIVKKPVAIQKPVKISTLKKKPGRKPKNIEEPVTEKDGMKFITGDEPEDDPLRKATAILKKKALRNKQYRDEAETLECSNCGKDVPVGDLSSHSLSENKDEPIYICNNCEVRGKKRK